MIYVNKLIKILKMNNLTLSTCESVTGGKLSSYLTSFNGSSIYFLGSIISYSNYSKINIIKIDAEIIEKFGTVSEKVAKNMAIKTKELFKSDLCISFTGNAGKYPIENKPAGNIYVGFVYKNILFSNHIITKSKFRKRIIKITIKKTIKWVILILKKENLI